MGEYVVGSVADLISNKGSTNSKTQKLKLKNKEKGLVTVKQNSKNDKYSGAVLQSKNKEAKNSIILSNETDNASGNTSSHVKEKIKVKKLNKKTLSNETNSASANTNDNVKEKIKKKKGNKKILSSETDSASANTKNNVKENKVVDQSKKRKKLLAEPVQNVIVNQEMPKKKRPKTDFLDLDHVPTDSEEEEGESGGKNFKENKKDLRQNVYKDFKENTIFVGNIPIDYNKQKIYRIFSKFGEIQNARIRCVPIADINMSKKVAAIKKQFNPKRNSLVAYVKYKSEESVNKALQANGMVVDGHHLRVDLAEESQERDNNKAVFVGGLPFDVEDDELWNFFQNCGQIVSVRVIRDSQTSMGKGFGYVNFDSTAAVELALQLDGLELKKRTINVKRCVKSRNKNKLNSFGRKKSEEMTNQLLCKRGRKFKEGKKKLKKNKNEGTVNFQGRTANMKQKKKKKLSKPALRRRKIVKILGAS